MVMSHKAKTTLGRLHSREGQEMKKLPWQRKRTVVSRKDQLHYTGTQICCDPDKAVEANWKLEERR